MTPRYKHDCNSCRFLGLHDEYDLYACGQGDGTLPTLIARYGDEGWEYTSGISLDIEPLREAARRCVRIVLGLVAA